jgi:eukaryotic-like serine/threonine-protein kinase
VSEATACTSCGGLHESSESCPLDQRIGQVVGDKYLIRRLLGEGGMGTVYEARHQVVGRRFAIKFLRAQFAEEAQMLARFRREAQAAGALENENIAAVTDFGSATDGSPYIVMEYLDGSDLAKLLRENGPLPVGRAVGAVIQACRGLNAAHDSGIVHRDLKPENLFVCKRGDGSDLIKVLDFGIAKLRKPDVTDDLSTETGMALGTPYYMSPEHAQGSKDIDHRTDIYALGVILYELLSGRRPHDGEGYNAAIVQIATQPPTPLQSLRPDLPAPLHAVISRALARDPEQRFASAAELADALAPFVSANSGPSFTVMPAPVTQMAVTQPLPAEPRGITNQLTPSPTARSSPQLQTTRRRDAWLLGLAAAMLLLATGIWLQRSTTHSASQPDSRSTPTPVRSPSGSAPAPSATADAATKSEFGSNARATDAGPSSSPAVSPVTPDQVAPDGSARLLRPARLSAAPLQPSASRVRPLPAKPLPAKVPPTSKVVSGSRQDLYKP